MKILTHTPVLTKEILEYLDPKPGENFIDATVGEGGHATEILKRNGPSGKLLGIDLDKSQIENSKSRLVDFKKRAVLANGSYANIKSIVKREGFGRVNGILLDLGFSSWHTEKSGRGFSFQNDEPLDMRYNTELLTPNLQFTNPTAEEIVNRWPEREIEKILNDFGEERFARQIAKEIAKERKVKRIKSTFELVSIIEKTVPSRYRHGRIHFATRAFQALRIAVNKELDSLKEFLPQAVDILSINGRLVVISFHSLEDRIVKFFLKEKEKFNQIKILTKKPITASNEEISENPRARSAKLRAVIKI